MFEKKRGTRFLASVMALVMLLSLAPVGALAAETGKTFEATAYTEGIEGSSPNGKTKAYAMWKGKEDGNYYLAIASQTGRNKVDAGFKSEVNGKFSNPASYIEDNQGLTVKLNDKVKINDLLPKQAVDNGNSESEGVWIILVMTPKEMKEKLNYNNSNGTFNLGISAGGYNLKKDTITIKDETFKGTVDEDVEDVDPSTKPSESSPRYVIRFYVSNTGTESSYRDTADEKYVIKDQPNSTYTGAVGESKIELSVAPGYAILTKYTDEAKDISTDDFENVNITGDENVRTWLAKYAKEGVPTGLTQSNNVDAIVEYVNDQYKNNSKGYELPTLNKDNYNAFRFVDAHYVGQGESSIHVHVQLIKQQQYIVEYNPNGGTGAMVDENLYSTGDQATVKANEFTRTDYTFAGWNTEEDGSGTSYNPNGDNNKVMIGTGNVTLYAQWTEEPATKPTITDVYVYFKMVDAAGNNISRNKINNEDLKKTVYNKEAGGATWATLGKIASAATLENGEKYTGTNATLKTVGNEATAQLKGDALHDSNKEIVNKVLANIEWFQLKQWDGATDYVPNGSSWHLDGKITGYTVTYNKGTTDSVDKMPVADEVVYYLSGSDYTVSDATPTREGYVFTGWKSDNNVYASKSKMNMPAKNVVLTAQWEKDTLVDPSVDQPEGITTGDGIADKYQIQVSFKAVNGTFKNGENPITEYTTVVTKYDNSTNKPSENGTAKLAAAHLKTATPNKDYKLTGWTKNNTGCDAPGVGTSVLNDDCFVVTFAKEEKPPIVDPTTKIKYTINQHFMKAKGSERTDLAHSDKDQSANKDTALSELIKGLAKDRTIGNDKYMYVSGKYTTKNVSDQPIASESKLTEDTTIDLYYYLDNWKDGSSVKEDNEKGGDGIPDCYQVLVKYQSGDTNRGSVGPLTMEVLTIKDATTGSPINEGTVKASGSTANVTGSSRNYFSNWTDTTGKQVGANATLEEQEFTAKGGETYTFTANFGHRSSSGGSSRPSTPTVTIPDDVPTGLNGKDHYAYIIGYGNNDVRPQNNITRAEVATIFFRLLTDETREANMTKSNGYNDVKDGDWFCCAVSTLSKMGIIKGYEDGSFKPNDPISRAEFAAIAARFDPDGDKTPASFFDVTSHWAKDEISIAANHGWIKGYEDGSFKPDQKITRAETMTLVNRVLNRLPETKDDLHKDMKTWVDNMDETAWYYLAVQEATNSHYFKNKTGTKFEQWTDLRDTRDWSELEK